MPSGRDGTAPRTARADKELGLFREWIRRRSSFDWLNFDWDVREKGTRAYVVWKCLQIVICVMLSCLVILFHLVRCTVKCVQFTCLQVYKISVIRTIFCLRLSLVNSSYPRLHPFYLPQTLSLPFSSFPSTLPKRSLLSAPQSISGCSHWWRCSRWSPLIPAGHHWSPLVIAGHRCPPLSPAILRCPPLSPAVPHWSPLAFTGRRWSPLVLLAPTGLRLPPLAAGSALC